MSVTLNVSRDVILDLAPLYLNGDASIATRKLVDEYVLHDPALGSWLREQHATVFMPLEDTLPPDTRLATLRRARRRLALQRWCFGFGWFFLAISLTSEFRTYRGRVVEFHLLARDYPLAASICVALAILCWSVYGLMRRRTLAIALTFGAIGIGSAAQPTSAQGSGRTWVAGQREFHLDAAHSTIAFEIPFAYSHVRGRFDDVTGWLLLSDTAQGGIVASSVAAIIRATSINTGSAHRDEHLRSSDFFDVQRFPAITFRSDRVELTSEGFVVVGPLTMHDRTRLVRIPCRLTLPPTSDPHHVLVAIVSGATRLARRDFDILGGNAHNQWFDQLRSSTMGDSVGVMLELHFWAPDLVNPDPTIGAAVARIDSLGIDSAIAHLRATFARDSAAVIASEYTLDAVGEALAARGKAHESFLWLHAVARLLPTSPDAMVSVGVANERLGDSTRATIWYRRALAFDSLHPRAMLRLQRLERVRGTRPSSTEPEVSRAALDTRQ